MFRERREVFITRGYRHADMETPDPIKATGAALNKIKAQGNAPESINATIGVFHKPHTERMPDWYIEAAKRALRSLPGKTKYDFIGNPEFRRITAELLFGDDTGNVQVIPTAGGSGAISMGSGVLKSIVPHGVPDWPNTADIAQRAGAIPIAYPYLDKDGVPDLEAFKATLDPESLILQMREQMDPEMRQLIVAKQMGVNIDGLNANEREVLQKVWEMQLLHKDISPIVEGVSKNPLGVSIPECQYEDIADALVNSNTVLQVDMAYLGFVNGVEKDLTFIRTMKKKGVKMLVYFSYSKFHEFFGDEREGAVVSVNFGQEDKMYERLLDHARKTTSAHPDHGQRRVIAVETNEELQREQRATTEKIRLNSIANRELFAKCLPSEFQYLAGANAGGPFIFIPDPDSNVSIFPYLYPELARQMGWKMPEDADDFPVDCIRIAGVPVAKEAGFGMGGVRLSIADTKRTDVKEMVKTIRSAYARCSAQKTAA